MSSSDLTLPAGLETSLSDEAARSASDQSFSMPGPIMQRQVDGGHDNFLDLCVLPPTWFQIDNLKFLNQFKRISLQIGTKRGARAHIESVTNRFELVRREACFVRQQQYIRSDPLRKHW